MRLRRIPKQLGPLRRYVSGSVRPSLTAASLNIARGNYKQLAKEDVAHFRSFLPESAVISDPDDIAPYNKEWTQMYEGQSALLLKPESTNQVSSIMRYCTDQNLAVVPVGGRTGLVGGAVSVYDEILLSLENMNKIRSFDPSSGVLVAEAGVILETADEFLKQHGHIFPLDLGAKGSCQPGGNVSTNAGGVRLLRYGSLHGSILGLEVVLSDGTVLNGLTTMRKDNTGYDLKQLFIGSEGTLGIVTALSVACPQDSKSINVAFLGTDSFENVLNIFRLAKERLSEILGSFESIDKESLDIVRNSYDFKEPLSYRPCFAVLLETRGSDAPHDREKIKRLFRDLIKENLIIDGILAETQVEAANLWKWREEIPAAATRTGGFLSYDLSLPLPKMFDIVDEIRQLLIQKGFLGDDQELRSAALDTLATLTCISSFLTVDSSQRFQLFWNLSYSTV